MSRTKKTIIMPELQLEKIEEKEQEKGGDKEFAPSRKDRILDPVISKKDSGLLSSEATKAPEPSKGIKTQKKGRFFLRIAKGSIYLLIFLLPLFFLPWTSNIFDFNKQALLLLLVLISAVCWLLKILISSRFEIKTNPFNIPIIVFVLSAGLSTIFSISRYGSFWGWPLSISSSFLSLLAFGLFYLLIVNLFEKDEVPFLLLILFISGFLAVLFFILQILGRFILPLDIAKSGTFNTLGSLNGLSIYLSVLLLMGLPLLYFGGEKTSLFASGGIAAERTRPGGGIHFFKKLFKIILGICVFALLLPLLIINFKTAWLLILIGSVVLFTFGIVNFRKAGKFSFALLIIFLLTISLTLTFFRFPLPGLPVVSPEASLNQAAEIQILKKIPPRNLILGSGPGTFIYNWLRYKPANINQTVFWAVRFGEGASEILDRLITNGVLGILSLLFLAVVLLATNFSLLLKKMESPEISDWFLQLGILGGAVGLLSAFFFYPASLTTFLIFWLLVGCTALLSSKEKKEYLFIEPVSKTLIASFFLVSVLVSGIGLSILFIQKYVAEVRYGQGLEAFQKGNNILAADFFQQAVNLNPKMDLYWRDLSQIYLIRANEVFSRGDLNQEEKISQTQAFIVNAVNAATKASGLDPDNAANWNARGFIYRNTIGSLGGADEWALDSYQKSKELEPGNPYILTEMGQVYLAKYDILAQRETEGNNLKLALENFEKAVELKPDYAPANFQIAMIYVRGGKIKEAIERLEITKKSVPFDIGLAFQLGFLYYNDNQFDKAKTEFERAVVLDPNYSNARYFLGLIYDKEGNKKSAIEQFERIEQFNPGNQDVKKILENLRVNLPALEGVAPAQPPIEEKNPEQLQ